MKKIVSILLILFSAGFVALSGEETGIEQNRHIKLLIKIPTRARYERFFKALDKYYEKLSKEIPYHFIITCDLDDPIMNSEKAIEKLKSYPCLNYYFGDSKSKIEACNRDIDPSLNFDILMLGSDDMIPIADNYDKIIVSNMEKNFPDFDGVLHFNDGIQGSTMNTLPILGKNYYKKFGYIYFPGYFSFFCDNEFMIVSRLLKKAVYIDMIIIEHQHYAFGKGPLDELYIKNGVHFAHDEALYYKRARTTFGPATADFMN